MAYYYVCPKCGNNLDPGEKCDCEEIIKQQEGFYSQKMKVAENGQFVFQWKNQETEDYQR